MKIPTAVLRQRITIAPYLGDSAYGPQWGDEVTVRARVEGKRRVVRRADGTEVTISASAIIRPDTLVDLFSDAISDHMGSTIPARSKVTWDGRPYELVGDQVAQGLSGPSHVELLLA